MTYRKKISLFSIISGFTLLLLTVLGMTRLEWEKSLISQIGTIAFLFILIGLLFNKLDGIEQKTNQNTDPEEKRNRLKIIDDIEIGVITTLSGISTGLIFLISYYYLDFGLPEEISERFLSKVCPPKLWPNFSVDEKDIIYTYPTFWKLFPEFIYFGAIAGMSVGFVFRAWKKFLAYLSRNGKLLFVNKGLVPYLLFGILWGFILGGVFNNYFFAKSDGRPFVRISTAAFAAGISVCSYVLFAYLLHRKKFTEKSIYDFVALIVVAIVLSQLIAILDSNFNMSQNAYCRLYENWDSQSNVLENTSNTWLIGATYGSLIGSIVMLLVAGYERIKKTYTKL